MNSAKRRRLEKAGWKVGSAKEFLGLTDEESAMIELKLNLAKAITEQRAKLGITQEHLARLLGSSQSRVAKMEAADATVSVDLLARGLFAMGFGPRALGKQLMQARKAA